MKKPALHHVLDYFLPHERNGHRPHIFGAASLAVFAIAIVLAEGAYFLETKYLFLETDFLASVLPSALMELTNADRQAEGVPGLSEDPKLDAVAQAVAEDMAAKGYFSHTSPDGKTPWYWLDQAGYDYSYAGQNLAVDFVDSTDVETAWMNSPTHRSNIVKPQYTRVGFGTASGIYEGRQTTFVVEYFAAPASAPTATVATAKPAKPAVSSTSPVQVLGTETANPAPTTRKDGMSLLLSSPNTLLMNILTALFTVVALAFISLLFLRGRFAHKRGVMAGLSLILLITGAMLLNEVSAGTVHIMPADGQAAAAIGAL